MTDNLMTRRQMLKVSGLTALVVGGALSVGTGARAATAGLFSAGEGDPYEAWRTLPRDGSPQALVAAAILAANPHNTQPWRFRVSADGIDVIADRSRALPATDPTGSELVAGLGCAVENMAVAAAAAGSGATVTTHPTAAGGAPARVTSRAAGPARAPTSSRPSPGDTRTADPTPPSRSQRPRSPRAKRSSPPSPACSSPGSRAPSATASVSLVDQATAAVIADGAQSDEIDRWWRATRDEIERHRDGMTIDAQSLPPVTVFLGKVLPPQTQQQNDQSWLKNTRDVHVKTAAAYGLLSVEDAGDAESQLQVGRAYQRLHLWATANGLAMQPLNQVTERIARDRSQGRTSPFEAPLAEPDAERPDRAVHLPHRAPHRRGRAEPAAAADRRRRELTHTPAVRETPIVSTATTAHPLQRPAAVAS